MHEHILLHVGNYTFVTRILRLFLNNRDFFLKISDFGKVFKAAGLTYYVSGASPTKTDLKFNKPRRGEIIRYIMNLFLLISS